MFACIFCILIIEIATIVWASSEILAATNNYLLVILHIVISLFVGITSAKSCSVHIDDLIANSLTFSTFTYLAITILIFVVIPLL